MSARRWFKVSRSWYDSPSHRRISGDALQLGPTLFYLADPSWDKDGPDAVPLLDAGFGVPLSVDDIAQEARWPVPRITKALEELERVGTLERGPDGAWVLPNFGRYQQDESTKRKRGSRSGQSAESPGNIRGQSSEKVEKPPSLSYSPSNSNSKLKEPDAIAALWDLYNELRRQIPGTRALKFTPAVARNLTARAKDHGTDEVCKVMRHYVAEALRDPNSVRWCNATTPFRPDNFARALAFADAPAKVHTSGHYNHTGKEQYAGGKVEL